MALQGFGFEKFVNSFTTKITGQDAFFPPVVGSSWALAPLAGKQSSRTKRDEVKQNKISSHSSL